MSDGVTISPRLQRFLSTPKVKRKLRFVLKEIAMFVLGRSSRNKISSTNPPSWRDTKAPFVKGFGKWRSPTNKRTRSFAQYKRKEYEELKTKAGKSNFLHFSGAMYDDMIKNAKIRIMGGGRIARITPANANKSRKYNFVHHNGSTKKNIAKRRAYQLDKTDERLIRGHIKKTLTALFK